MKLFLIAVLGVVSALAAEIQMPPTCTTPDGMCVAPDGQLVIAAPNCNRKQPGCLFKLAAPGGVPVKWFEVPAHPQSGYSQPMGVCFGPEGELYVCDCQGKGKARVLCFTFKDGKVASCETVAEGLHNANGVKYLNGRLYVTQAFLFDIPRGDGAATSGLYMFNAKDRNVRVKNLPSDRECVFCDVTRNPRVKCGLNGVAVDSKGNVYTGNYGDGTLWKLTPGKDGRIAKAEQIVHAEAGVKSPDGLCVDAQDNVYIADMFGNQTVRVAPDGKITVIKRGGLKRPSEPCVWRGNVYTANYGGTTVDETPLP